jgi:RNA polymerase-associated protein RTF1
MYEKDLILERCIEEEKKILYAEEIRKNRMKQSSKIQNWVKVNERARAANKNADVEAYKVELERLSLGGKDNDFDPYARRKMRPQILWDVGKDKSDEKNEAPELAKKNEASVSHDGAKNDSTNPEVSIGKENSSEPESHNRVLKNLDDLAIDEELIARSSIELSVTHANKGLAIIGRVRKGLSLDEYLVRKAAGTL